MKKIKEVVKFLQNIIAKDDTVILACSGGPDSMCLCDLLLEARKNKSFKIVIAHVHHNVRKESDSELEFVKNYAQENDIVFESMKINNYVEKNFESEARDKRYTFFDKLQKKYGAKMVFTAHHGDDLMETILMRIVRGSSLKGYSGFDMISEYSDYKIVRPLISFTKSQILEYNKERNIPYVTDYTNGLDVHTRNRYRKYVLPRLKDEDENVHLKFIKFSKLLSEYNNYVYKESLKTYKNVYKNNVLNIDKFSKLDELIKKNIVSLILSDVYQSDILYINDKHLNNILKLIESTTPNGKLDLPKGRIAVKSYNMFYITDKKSSTDYEFVFDKKIMLPNGKTIEKVNTVDNNSNYVCKLSTSDIKLPIIIRNRRDGDYIYIMNLKGKRKIKDVFMDSKVPLNDRKIWPIVTDSENNVLWIPGIKKSKYNKQKDEKYDIILKYY